MSTVLPQKLAAIATIPVNSVETKDVTVTSQALQTLPLGRPRQDRKFLWERRDRSYDPDDTATQPSVFDDPDVAPEYQPPSNWENIHRFNPLARWTWREEDKVVRKMDIRIFLWTCVMFFGLEIDRANLSQALTDGFLPDLGLDTNDFNIGNTVFALAFLSAELPSQLVSKWAGPDRWIPTQLTLWSVVAASQFWLSGRGSFLACRALIGFLQGGFIPDIILYLSYFYKHSEMNIRLAIFWISMQIADIIAAFLAYGILHMRGVLGYAGWRWMFLIEGLMTLVIGILSFGLMPAGPTETANWFRGKKGWFSDREEEIMVNRIIRDDPSKSSMHNRERITLRLLWKSLTDFDLWPIYLMGLTSMIPQNVPRTYLTLSLRALGFDTFRTNLLVIPSQILTMITMLSIAWAADKTKRVIVLCFIPMIWVLPSLIWLRTSYTLESPRWTVYGVITVLVSSPLTHPILVSLASRNSNSVRSRTVSAAVYNMSVQVGVIIGSNIYRQNDLPLYRVGNSVLLGLLSWNVAVYTGVFFYYRHRNASRDNVWDSLSEDEKIERLQRDSDKGNKRLDFRFHY
ncbi:major facilitator superfamily protein [Sarocladium implicatum]|nr:major facilitator superfamily protein [Sarocladium implicatum]